MLHTPWREDRLTTLSTLFPSEDWMLSPRAMQGYLQYRLYALERQISRLMRELSRNSAPPFPSHLQDDALSEEDWALWASLNYLLQAYDTLQEELSWSQRRLN